MLFVYCGIWILVVETQKNPENLLFGFLWKRFADLSLPNPFPWGQWILSCCPPELVQQWVLLNSKTEVRVFVSLLQHPVFLIELREKLCVGISWDLLLLAPWVSPWSQTDNCIYLSTFSSYLNLDVDATSQEGLRASWENLKRTNPFNISFPDFSPLLWETGNLWRNM